MPGTMPGGIEKGKHMFEISDAERSMLREVIHLEGGHIDEAEALRRMYEATRRAHLAASSRMDRHWEQMMRLNPLSPMPLTGLETYELRVVPRLSYRQGLVTDFQGITITATAHAPACQRLSALPSGAAEIVPVPGFTTWLQERAEQAAEAERAEYGVEVAAQTGQCVCLNGTLVFAPRLYPDQPEDVVFLVGPELQERYSGAFERWHFTVEAVNDLDEIGRRKDHRWMHLSVDEVCTCEPPHEEWEACPVASADLTFDCDRDCQIGCDWVLHPQGDHAQLQVHGTEIDLGPLGEDCTVFLADDVIPKIRT
ncbi:hypothetical protein [Glycomyces sp. NPDC047010]|uniref:hypothetical protein n=1 Tax=Glycomyces sp. NPDC047010 TaxID=3155023 RepID=UPI0033F2D510